MVPIASLLGAKYSWLALGGVQSADDSQTWPSGEDGSSDDDDDDDEDYEIP